MVDSYENVNWLTLYRQAVLEQDPRKLHARVTQAQHAIGCRARELWYSGAPDTPERRQMDAASHVLGVLRTIGVKK